MRFGFSVALTLLLCLAPALAQSQSTSLIEDVTTEDVKRFLDPTRMVNAIEYSFLINKLPGDTTLYTNRFYGGWSINHWSALWIEAPIQDFSVPGERIPADIGDVRFGGGLVLHEDLSSRYTGAAVWFETLAPTGSARKATGFGTWVLSPGAGLAFNPTDKFPVYVWGNYFHSIGELQIGPDEDIALKDKVRSIELNVQTAHILPKGFYVAALPSFTFNFEQDFNLFSLGVGVGRALNRNLAVSGGYVHHIAGEKAFNRAIFFGAEFVWGEKVAPAPDPAKALKAATKRPDWK